MLDMFGFNSADDVNTRIFHAVGPSFSNSPWLAWVRPRGCSFAYIRAVGSGGGAGGGFTAAAGSARGGGGGGGSGAITSGVFPLISLPAVLYINAGLGGPGGAASAAGTVGAQTKVARYPSSATADYVMLANGGGFGAAGTGSAGGAGGGGGAVSSNTASQLVAWSNWVSMTGGAGTAGGAQTGAVGVNAAIVTVPLSGGAGGGGTPTANTDFAGGNITGNGLIPTVNGGAAAAGAGLPGLVLSSPSYFTGGSGGGTAGAAGVAGRGGDGAFGSGGGGGGGGVTGGAGGTGGNGFVIIVCW